MVYLEAGNHKQAVKGAPPPHTIMYYERLLTSVGYHVKLEYYCKPLTTGRFDLPMQTKNKNKNQNKNNNTVFFFN